MADRAAPGARGAIGGASIGTGFALVIATLAVVALVIEGTLSLRKSFGEGRSLLEALFLFFRYFTILTNLGVAVLMAGTVARRRRAPLAPGLYAAVTVYAAVTCAAYEVLLRRLWSPHGMQFGTDLVMHDIVPALTMLFWVFFAPKQGLCRRDAAWLLAFPAAYFAVTLTAGARGAGYPYDFLDAASLGYPVVLLMAAAFLALFHGLGLLMVAAARAWA